MTTTRDIELSGCDIGPDWMIGSRTRRVDSWSPNLEQILMPRIHIEPRQIKLTLADGISDLSQDRLSNLARRLPLQRFRKAVEVGGVLYDTRFDTSHNYAHVMINLIGRLLLAKSEGLVEDLSNVCVIVPKNAPTYAHEAWKIAGVRVEATNLPVAGRHLTLSSSSNAALMLRAEWARHFASRIAPLANGPKKLYVSRRGKRCATNDAQIRELLESRGYTTIFPEEHSVEKQLAYFLHAEDIVAVHGAGLAGLVLKTASNRCRLIEIFGAGYVVQLYRILTRCIGCDWLGVRGTINPGDVKIDSDSNGTRRRQAASFAVDIDALKLALDMDSNWIAEGRRCTSASTIVLK